jgi:putative DNA primase/helicase
LNIVVIGAGLSGLTAAATLREAGASVQLVEADAHIGGRIRAMRDPVPTVPETPSRDDALLALGVLTKPFREFVFATPADRSVMLSAVLTALIRRNLPSAPLIVVLRKNRANRNNYWA